MTIKRYADFIAEQQRKLRGAGLAEEAKSVHPFETYPPKNNLHLLTNEGDEHHVIEGVEHNQANAHHVFNQVNKAGAKIAKMGVREFERINGDAPDHHELANHKDFSPGDKPTMVHKSVEDYVKHHAKLDAKWVKQNSEDME